MDSTSWKSIKILDKVSFPILRKIPFRSAFFFLILFVFLSACGSPQVVQGDISVSISVEGEMQELHLPSGSTVQDALTFSGIELGSLDRIDPPVYTVLSEGDVISILRVREEFEIQQVVIPFDHLQMRNESLPAGETHLLQSGQNGLKEITIRKVFEDDKQVSSTPIQETILTPAVPEIVMLGIQAPFAPIEIPGKLVYLAGGNAWMMEGSTSNRRPLVTTGDLDGRIFRLSPDGNWLMFTRKSTKPPSQEINTLWIIDVTDEKPTLIPTKISNIVHFADWVPDRSTTIIWSTAEPQEAAPGWSANNDLWEARFVPTGGTTKPLEILETNFGGQFGWWGTDFFWSPDGSRLAYSRPDGIGFVDQENGIMNSFMDITLYDTHSDWAWIPGLAWGSDSTNLYVVTHAPGGGLIGDEESPLFDLSALSLVNGTNVILATNIGMFAQPSTSRIHQDGNENRYQVAYLQAIFPEQSATSNYRLMVMDRDGSNQKPLFPDPDLPGLEAQIPMWSPSPGPSGNDYIAISYQGNLWLIDSASGQSQQVTSDGLIVRIEWK